MSDETSCSRRNFLETVAGLIFLPIVPSFIFGCGGGGGGGGENVPLLDMEKLLQSSGDIASLLGYKRLEMIVNIGSILVDILRPPKVVVHNIVNIVQISPIPRDSITDIHTEMQTVVDLYFEKRYTEAISYIDQSPVISECMADENFKQSIQVIKNILQELIWIDALQNNNEIDSVGESDGIFNLHQIYLSVWYGKTGRSEGVEQFRNAYQALKNEGISKEDDIALYEIALVFATLVFNYDFQNDQSLPSYESAIENAQSRFTQINLPTHFAENQIIADQWKNLRLRLEVFNSNTNDRDALNTELYKSTLEPDEKKYLIGVNALYSGKPEKAIETANQIGSQQHRDILLAFGTYSKAKKDSDTSDETQNEIRRHFESIRNSNQEFFCQLYHNNTPIFGYVYESRDWTSFLTDIFGDSEIEKIENICKVTQ
jgi:hypothetical protein